MEPKGLRVPSRIHYKPSGQDVVFLPAAEGRRQMVYLGEHDSPAAIRRYREVLADHLGGKVIVPLVNRSRGRSDFGSVAQLCAAFLLHAQSYYVDGEGRRSRTTINFVLALRPLLKVFRDVPVDQFTVRDLATVRQELIDTEFGHKLDEAGKPIEGTGKKRCRRYINECIQRVKAGVSLGSRAPDRAERRLA